jgi:hypothetical protein
VAQYWIRELGPRRPFPQYVSFLFGGDAGCDTDGNAQSATDCTWTELTVIDRPNPSERVAVSLQAEKPLTFLVTSDREELAARLVYALIITSGVNVFARSE